MKLLFLLLLLICLSVQKRMVTIVIKDTFIEVDLDDEKDFKEKLNQHDWSDA